MTYRGQIQLNLVTLMRTRPPRLRSDDGLNDVSEMLLHPSE
jgi:hypothetical protein